MVTGCCLAARRPGLALLQFVDSTCPAPPGIRTKFYPETRTPSPACCGPSSHSDASRGGRRRKNEWRLSSHGLPLSKCVHVYLDKMKWGKSPPVSQPSTVLPAACTRSPAALSNYSVLCLALWPLHRIPAELHYLPSVPGAVWLQDGAMGSQVGRPPGSSASGSWMFARGCREGNCPPTRTGTGRASACSAGRGAAAAAAAVRPYQ